MSETPFMALAAAFLWASSAPVVNLGLHRLPDTHKATHILLGLMLSLIAGSLALLLVFGPASVGDLSLEPSVIGAGLFTFAIGTGLYYLCGHAYGVRTELAAQFANVKPLITVVFGLLVFSEPFGTGTAIALLLVGAGLTILLVGTAKGRMSWLPITLGGLLAISWSLGEVFVKLSVVHADSDIITVNALISATVIYTLCAVPFFILRRGDLQVSLNWMWPFAVHGVISFGAAYTLFFGSIAQLGLAKTVLITVFWPGIAILLSFAVNRLRGVPNNVPAFSLYAMVLLLFGSFVQVVFA